MIRRVRISVIALALGALALSVAGGSASATNTIKTPSKISIKSSGLDFSGTVTSSSYQPCRQYRKVRLFRVVSGGPDQRVGSDTTNSHGRWAITPQGSAGISLAHFYARVKKSSQGAAGTIYVCNAAKSATVKPTT
jgi:hypothetical protein